MAKTIVLGLDGACWPLLAPWLEAGELPNLATLRQEAAWGPLTSQFPPVTSPNWRCYATGRNPAKLGVFWWEIVDRQQHTIRHPSARDYQTQPFWELLAKTGQRVAVVNFPTGYPPAPLKNGYFAAGGPGAKETGFAYPASWEVELKQKYNYRVHPPQILQVAEQVAEHLDDILLMMQARFDVAFDLLAHGIDFLHLTLFYINVLQHFCYQDEPTRAGWQLIDRNLGRLRQIATDDGYNLLLMSDHGCGPVDTVFYINTWLVQEGYLKLNLSPTTQNLSRLGVNRQQFINLARRLGLTSLLRQVVPQQLQQALPNSGGTFSKEAKAQRIDWANSQAVASGQGPVYLLLSPDQPDYEALRGELAAKLAELQNPITDQLIAAQVLTREEVYKGPFFDQAPDLVFEQGPGIHTSGGVGHPQSFELPYKWAADNVLNGLFLAWGPDFASQGLVDGCRIIDLAPTILHLQNQAIPDDIDGIVLDKLFASNSQAGNRNPVYCIADEVSDRHDSTEDEDEIADRLTALGYLE